MRANKASSIAELLRSHYPDARCTLVFSSPFQCLCAVLLSAQCTDAKVNRVTPSLFSAYPSPKELSEANLNQVEGIIHSLGLSHSKAMHLIAMAKRIQEKYGGRVPDSYEELLDLPGVGNKTARVVLMECFHQPAFPVDTHVERVSTRLGLVREGLQPAEIEKVLEKTFPEEEEALLHHCFIRFGREVCHSRNPECDHCFLRDYCSFFSAKNTSFKTGK